MWRTLLSLVLVGFLLCVFLDERQFSPLCAATALWVEHTNLPFLEHIKASILSRMLFYTGCPPSPRQVFVWGTIWIWTLRTVLWKRSLAFTDPRSPFPCCHCLRAGVHCLDHSLSESHETAFISKVIDTQSFSGASLTLLLASSLLFTASRALSYAVS